MRRFAILSALLLILCSLLDFAQIEVCEAGPRIIVVPDDYSSIQRAILVAGEGDTIQVKRGVYHENVGIDKCVSLVGEDRDETIIDGRPEEGYRIPLSIKCDGVSISGFTLRYGYAGIQMGGVEDCVISGNKITNATYGIRAFKSLGNDIIGNLFDSIRLGSAIRLEHASHNFVNGNYIQSCTEGIQCMESANYNLLSENIIIDVEDPGISLQNSIQNTVTRNTVENSGCGISIYIASHNTVRLNNFINNSVNVGANEWYARQWGYGYSVNDWEQNYYSDYNGTDSDGDGVGDTSYVINEENQDDQPLLEPVIISNFTPEGSDGTNLILGMMIATGIGVLGLILWVYHRKAEQNSAEKSP